MSLWPRFLAPAGRLASISLRNRLFIFLSGTKALLLKERRASPEAEFAPWRPKRRIGALNLWSGVGFLSFRTALRLARDGGGGEGKLGVGRVTVGWREVTEIDA